MRCKKVGRTLEKNEKNSIVSCYGLQAQTQQQMKWLKKEKNDEKNSTNIEARKIAIIRL